MDDKTFSKEELDKLSKDMIISLYLQLNSSFQLLSEQNNHMMKQLSNLQEQLSILTNYRFGRKSEKSSKIIDGQYTLDLATGEILLLNDIETEADKTDEEFLREAKMREQKKRKKGVRE